MLSHITANALRLALADLPKSAYSADQAALGPFHQKVCDAVDELKATGMAPEHVLLALKAVVVEATAGAPTANVLVEKMVKWCLAQYFKEQANTEQVER